MKNVYVNIRMTQELKDHLANLANDNCRSLSSQIVWMLSSHDLASSEKPQVKTSKSTIDCPDCVSEQTWEDFKRLRAAKKAPVTQRALDGIYNEAMKAGISMEAALRECCARGWTGFKAEWMKSDKEKLSAIFAPSNPMMEVCPANGLMELGIRK
jgi:hypothetical protein